MLIPLSHLTFTFEKLIYSLTVSHMCIVHSVRIYPSIFSYLKF